MSRLLDFHQSEESVLVSRVLLQIHKAIDQNFPNVSQPSRKFAKTLFSETDEPTHNKTLPNSDVRPSAYSQSHAVPPPPPSTSAPKPPLSPKDSRSPAEGSPKAIDTQQHKPSLAANNQVIESGDMPSNHSTNKSSHTFSSKLSAQVPMTSSFRSIKTNHNQKRLVLAASLALLFALAFKYRYDLILILENLAHR